MPELPDVEAVISRIKQEVIGQKIIQVKILVPSPIQIPNISQFKQRLKHSSILKINRRGKFVLFSLSLGSTLVVHLRMTGDLIVFDAYQEMPKYTRVIFTFESGKELCFIDQRKLGKMYLVSDEDFHAIKSLNNMGPEPLDEKFSLEAFQKLLKNRKGKIKALLMEQSFIAGIGNVYGDEILFQAGIRPQRKVNELKAPDVKELFQKIKEVLKTACKHQANLSSLKGWFATGRREGFCAGCGKFLKRVKIQGRYSYFCPHCQR